MFLSREAEGTTVTGSKVKGLDLGAQPMGGVDEREEGRRRRTLHTTACVNAVCRGRRCEEKEG